MDSKNTVYGSLHALNGAAYSDMVTSSSQKMYMKLFVVALHKEAKESKATVTGACSFAITL